VLFVLYATQRSKRDAPAVAAAAKTYSLTIMLTYYGNDARAKYEAETKMAAYINKANGMCQFGVCAAVKAASKGAVAVTSATANTTKTFSDGKA
jgi:hypothetical protein